MQANSFEKQVQQKMDELSFIPSAPVWMNIEKEIRKKKQKRRMLLWLPLFALLLTGGIGWFYTSKDADSRQETSLTPANHTKVHQAPLKQVPVDPSNNNHLIENTTSLSTGKANKKFNNKTALSASTLKQTINSYTKTAQNKPVYNQKKWKAGKRTNLSDKMSSIGVSSSLPVSVKKANEEAETIHNATRVNLNSDSTANSTTDQEQPTTQDSTQILSKDSIRRKDSTRKIDVTKPKAKPKWVFAPAIKMGVAGVSKDVATYNSNSRYYAAQQNVGPVADNSVNTPQNNLSYSIGLAAQKELTKRVQFETGLQYTFLSNTTDVGRIRRIDTTVSGQFGLTRVTSYYEKSAENNYTNRFHYISLPIAMNFKLLSNTPVWVQGGLTIHKMITTNGLVYNSQSRIYYQDKKAFNKTQLSTELGCSTTKNKLALVRMYNTTGQGCKKIIHHTSIYLLQV
jgi:hypothetical protein